MECKNGNTYNGTLVQCDKFMNVKLEDVVMTTKDGEKFFKIPEVQLKCSQLRLFRIVILIILIFIYLYLYLYTFTILIHILIIFIFILIIFIFTKARS